MIIPTSNDQDQVVTQPVDKAPVIPADPIKDHGLRLSQNMKLAIKHVGIKENAIPVSEEWKYVDGEAVPPVGRDVKVSYTNPTEDGYIDPIPAFAENAEQQLEVKTEGRRGEKSYDPINNENYLDRPGMEVKTSETYMALQEESDENGESTEGTQDEGSDENGEDTEGTQEEESDENGESTEGTQDEGSDEDITGEDDEVI